MRGATNAQFAQAFGEMISIHAPREGSDNDVLPYPMRVIQFQSTLPVRGATMTSSLRLWAAYYFNPRSP